MRQETIAKVLDNYLDKNFVDAAAAAVLKALEPGNVEEAADCRRMAEMLRDVPGGIGEVIDYLESRAFKLEKEE